MDKTVVNIFKKAKVKCNDCENVWISLFFRNVESPFCPKCGSRNTEIVSEPKNKGVK